MRGVLFDQDGLEIRGTLDGIRFSVTDDGTERISHTYLTYDSVLHMKKVLEKILENAPPIVHICGGGLDAHA